MTVNVIFVGSLKESFFAEAVAEYEKRLGAYCKINNILIKDERLSDRPSDAEIATALRKEGERILAAIPPRSYKIAMCVEGKQMKSEDFASLLDTAATSGYSEVSFVIGGSFGLADEVKSACDKRMSISMMTFPHRMMRVILLEQVYRAYNIIGGGKYHK
ncbi:MAG: 23S rRNA (pseudouridine(1915)-N(3))-methyltransferase RlmH [Clostridia bacterium]|nr:23S rRNA (pseudouridine(1915)-N(3))-methyltransferase RlmH [Clostridia bacterium]